MEGYGMSNSAKEMRKKPPVGASLLPNLFTASCLFCGFYAMTLVSQGHFVAGSMILFLGLLADTLDGRAARITGTESDFGKQFDSLADMITSGVAPAWMAYRGDYLWELGLDLVFFVAATAMRLARFNCLAASCNFKVYPAQRPLQPLLRCCGVFKKVFCLPTLRLVASIVFALSCLMVSDIPYYGFKTVVWKVATLGLSPLVVVARPGGI